MRVELLYFAVVRDLTGSDGEEVELPDTVVDIRALSCWLEGRRPELAGRLAQVRFAIDEAFVRDEDRLHEGAVVALIPPVAGG